MCFRLQKTKKKGTSALLSLLWGMDHGVLLVISFFFFVSNFLMPIDSTDCKRVC